MSTTGKTLTISLKGIILLILGLYWQSCNTENCLESVGKINTYNIPLNQTTTVEFNDIFDVIYIPDSVERITLTCGENLFDGIYLKTDSNKIVFEDHNSCNFLRSYDHVPVITIYSSQINHVIVPGNISFTMNDTLHNDHFIFEAKGGVNTVDLKINTRKLEFSVNGGTGDYMLSGFAGLAYVYFFGTGFYWGENLRTGYQYVHHRSTGDMHLNADIELNIKLFSNGNAYYHSVPDTLIVDQSQGTGAIYPFI
jgi:hypothetical protein